MKKPNPFYLTAAWKQKREHILRRDKYTDQLELRAGRRVPATMVHHILPREEYPEYALSDWNLISISDETHRELHTIYGNLSSAGQELMRRTAEANGIKLSKLTLVVGLPGTGKTTLVKRMLGDGLAYDLDYIAAAFKLSAKTDSRAARRMANNMVRSFAANARNYSSHLFVVRTAPDIEELTAIDPDEIIVCERVYSHQRQRDIDLAEKKNKIAELKAYAEANEIKTIIKSENS